MPEETLAGDVTDEELAGALADEGEPQTEGEPTPEPEAAAEPPAAPAEPEPQAAPAAAPAQPTPTAGMTPQQMTELLLGELNRQRQENEQLRSYLQQLQPAGSPPPAPFGQPSAPAAQQPGADLTFLTAEQIAQLTGYDPSDPQVRAWAEAERAKAQRIASLEATLAQRIAPLEEVIAQQKAAQVEEWKWQEFLQTRPPDTHAELAALRPKLKEIAYQRNLPHWFDAYGFYLLHNTGQQTANEAMQQGVRQGYTAAQQQAARNKLANLAGASAPRRGSLEPPPAQDFEECALRAGVPEHELIRRGA